ncbi:MAG: type II toxin-antitoxin system VapC family toxin [Arachidicoccus sp.]|nr:type II toxin-antitoxin system VapC family toxin [Arachidicoccus sp.]
MANYVLDSYALLSFFRNEEGADKVQQLLKDATANKHTLYISCINAGEVYYMTVRKDSKDKAEFVWKAMQQFPIKIIDIEMEFVANAAKLKAHYSISYADAFAAALTIKTKATLVTGDDEFLSLSKEPGFKVKFL